MANRCIPQNIITTTAHINFSEYLKRKLEETHTPIRKLSRDVGIGKTSIYEYLYGYRYPKLDMLAMIFSYFGDDEIRIPLTEAEDE